MGKENKENCYRSDQMVTISESMSQDHRRCDDLFLSMERAVSTQKWDEAQSQARDFEQAMIRHFSVEEDQLFPAMESSTPQAEGPIRVMTMEHVQMRHMIRKLLFTIDTHARSEALSIAETLLMTIQQHNMKEENILYPMADRCAAEVSEDITVSIQSSTQ